MVDLEMAEGKFGKVIAFRMKPGTDVQEGLLEACKRSDIKNGVIVSAIGSLDGAVFFDAVERSDLKSGYGYGDALTLVGPIELTGASGIVCHDDSGEINLHVHMSMSDRYGNAHGGHLAEGTKVLLTVDVVIAEIQDLVMGRAFDPNLGGLVFAPRQS